MKWQGYFIDKREEKPYIQAPYTRLKWELDKSGQWVVISKLDREDKETDEPKVVMHHSQFHRLVVTKVFVYK